MPKKVFICAKNMYVNMIQYPYKHKRAKLMLKKAQKFLVSVPLVFNAKKGGSVMRDFPARFKVLKICTLVALLYWRHKSVIKALQKLHLCIDFV